MRTLWVILTAALVGCSSQPPPNLVLISVDTLRADHLGCYGYSRAKTPNFDSPNWCWTGRTRLLPPLSWNGSSSIPWTQIPVS